MASINAEGETSDGGHPPPPPDGKEASVTTNKGIYGLHK